MDLNTAIIHRPLFVDAIVLFSLVWPLVAFRFIGRGKRSAAPLVAMLLPVVVALCGTWLGLQNILYGMTVATTGREPWIAEGVIEAFALLRIGAYSAAGVAMVMLIRRHRPVLDRGTIILAALIVAQALAASAIAADLGPVMRTVYFVRAGAGAAAATAIAALLLLVRIARNP